MKIAVAQFKSVKGDVPANIANHKKVIQLAIDNDADVVIFPELSLTGYEPTLANELAMDKTDKHWDEFKVMATAHGITIIMGAPIKTNVSVCISLVVFEPNKALFIYSKKYLHPDETSFFEYGENTTNLVGKDNNIALAICYEVLVPEHSEESLTQGVIVYLASVAKGESGIASAKIALSDISKKHAVYSMMSNTIGLSDNFTSFGGSLAINKKGELLKQLDNDAEGLMIVDTVTQETKTLSFTSYS